MEIKVKTIPNTQEEYMEIGCHKYDERINEIVRFVKFHQGSVEGYLDQRQYQIPITDIYYIESIEEHTFIYLKKTCYESRRRLYEFEQLLEDRHFMRISKSVLVNMMKINAIKPALNGRFLCLLNNDEKVIISRKYVPDIKDRLKGEKG